MKRFIACFIACLLTVGVLPASAAAHEYVDLISFEEYSAAIEAEYAKYGIEGGVYEPEGEFICTPEDLETSLAIVREYIKNRTIENVPELEETESSDYLNSSIMPTIMPMTVTMTDSYWYTNISLPTLPRECTIETTVDITINVQNATIISVSEPSLEVVSGTGIADWVRIDGYSTKINLPNKSVSMPINCTIKEETAVGPYTSWAKKPISYVAVFDDIPL